jgi:hypothetical protein
MTKATPKGKTPSLIGGASGRPNRVAVMRKSECYRCHDELLKGTNCIEIPQIGGAHSSSKRMCDECFGKMLAKTEEDLAALRQL